MTIEHIAPQNPSSGVAAAALHGIIGNLVLVSEDLNGKLKNKPFKDKRKIMADAAVPLDDIVKNAAGWSDAEIKARTETMADRLHDNDI